MLYSIEHEQTPAKPEDTVNSMEEGVLLSRRYIWVLELDAGHIELYLLYVHTHTHTHTFYSSVKYIRNRKMF